jgi:hypothetical protein
MAGDGMSKEITPAELSKFIRCVAAGIDASKKPRADMVASDIRCAIAAVNGDEGASARVRAVISAVPDAPPRAAAKPISLRFNGELGEDVMRRAAAEVAKRRPALRGKKLQFTLTAKPV